MNDGAPGAPRPGGPGRGPSDESQQAGQRVGDAGRVQRLGQGARVLDLPAGARAHEPAQLLLTGSFPLGGLLAEGAQRPTLALVLDDPLDPDGAERADQLVLEVGDTYEEPDTIQEVASCAVTGQAGALQAAPEAGRLGSVAQARETDAPPAGTKQVQEVPEVGRAT